MTEAEAKEKWCPFARDAEDGEGTYNRGTYADGRSFPIKTCNCIASECMAWHKEKVNVGGVIIVDENEGYCGLAGKP